MKHWLGLLLGITTVVSAQGEDWPHWRGPHNDGTSSESLTLPWPNSGPKALWTASVGTGFSSISVSQGRAYTMGNTNGQDTVWCLEALTGKELWKHSYTAKLDPQYYEGGPGSTPTVSGGRVFVLSKWGDVFCFNATNGAVLWNVHLWDHGIRSNRWGFAGSPMILDNRVLLNAGTSGVALDRDTGKMLWFNGTNVAGYATPQLFGGPEGKVLLFGAKYLYAVDPASGREAWRFPFETGYDINNTDPIIRGNRVFISSYNHGCALLEVQEKPEVVYESKQALRSHLSPGILIGDYLYAFHGDASAATEFRCIQFSTGEVKWSVKDPKNGSLISVSGKLLILSDKGELIAADPDPTAFKPICRAHVLDGRCWTPPSLSNGLLLARNALGKMVCLDIRPAP